MILTLLSHAAIAQLERVEPPNWWLDFEDNTLQLMVKEPGISDYEPEVNYPGVSITKVHKADSPNYLFIDLLIGPATEAGSFEIVFKAKGKKKLSHTYELKKRQNPSEGFYWFRQLRRDLSDHT